MSLMDFLIAMKQRKVITYKGITGLVNGISVEDGSGLSWNITMLTFHGTVTVYFREGK